MKHCTSLCSHFLPTSFHSFFCPLRCYFCFCFSVADIDMCKILYFLSLVFLKTVILISSFVFVNTFSASVYLSNFFLSYASKCTVPVQIEHQGFLEIQTHFSPKPFYYLFQFAVNDSVSHHVQNTRKVSGPEFTITNMVHSHDFITT